MYNRSIKRIFSPTSCSTLIDAFNNAQRSVSIKLKSYQIILADSSRGHPFSILQSPCGSGKTIVAKYMAAKDIYESKSNKDNHQAHVFIVPQNHHMNSYAKKCSFTNDGHTIMDFNIPTFHRYGSGSEQKRLKEFRKYLKGKEGGYSECIIMTHAGFCILWDRGLNEEEKRIFVENTIFYIDECHHITETDKDEGNKIGKIVRSIIDMYDKGISCRAILMTATLYRGDFKPILSTENMKKFFVGNVLFEDYFKSTGITGFNYDFVEYENDALETLLIFIERHRNLKQIVVLPRTGSMGRDDKTHKRYLEAFYKIYQKDRVLDLVDTRLQKSNLLKLSEDPESYDIVLSCNLFVEGSDWPPSSVIHNLSFGQSLLKVHQIMGRIIRPYKDKIDVHMYSYINNSSKRNKRDIYTDRFNALVSVMIMTNMIKKIKLPKIQNSNTKKSLITRESALVEDTEIKLIRKIAAFGLNLLSGCKQDPDSYTDALAKKLFFETDTNQKKNELSPEATFLQDYFENKEELREYIQAHFVTLSRIIRNASQEEMEQVDIEFIRKQGFDKIWEKEVLSCGKVFGTDSGLGYDTFKEFRKMISPFKKEMTLIESKANFVSVQVQADTKSVEVKSYERRSEVLLNKWVRVKRSGKSVLGRIISEAPLLARCYKSAIIEDIRVLIGNYKFYQKENVWVPKTDTKWSCLNRNNKRFWKKDEDFGKDYKIALKDIEQEYSLEEASL